MARPKSVAPPTYQLHRPSGRAKVRVAGRDVYLGKHGSPESVAAYQKLVNEWLNNGRRLPDVSGASDTNSKSKSGTAPATITVVELIDQYREWSEKEYGDSPSGEHRNTMDAVVPVVRLFGRLAAEAFGPNALRQVRQTMIEGRHRKAKEGELKPAPLSRTTINDRIHRIRRVFRWGVSRELIPASVIQSLDAVDAIRAGRGQARERQPVRPVSEDIVAETVKQLSAPLVDMVNLQLLTGMRSTTPLEWPTFARYWPWPVNVPIPPRRRSSSCPACRRAVTCTTS